MAFRILYAQMGFLVPVLWFTQLRWSNPDASMSIYET